MPEPKVTCVITNGDIYNCIVQFKKEKKFSQKYVAEQLRERYSDIKKGAASDATLYNKGKHIYTKATKLNSNRQYAAKESFLRDTFPIPSKSSNDSRCLASATTPKEKLYASQLIESKSEKKSLKRSLDEAFEDNAKLSTSLTAMEVEYENILVVVSDLTDKVLEFHGNYEGLPESLVNLRRECREKTELLEQKQTQLSAIKSKLANNNTRNLAKKLKRRDASITKLKAATKEEKERADNELEEKVTVQKALVETCDELDKMKAKVEDLKNEKKRLQTKLNYHRNKRTKIQDTIITELHQGMHDLKKDYSELEKLVDMMEAEEVVTFCDGKYVNEVREVIMDLLSLNVSMSAVNTVISTVLKKLGHKDVGKLPSNGLKSVLLDEAKLIAAAQVSEAMTVNPNNCLHQDGTSKFHKHFQGYQVTLSDGHTMTLGLHEVAGGTTSDLMEAFNNAISDLTETMSTTGPNRENTIAKLITSINSTMSDQGPTSGTFNAQLEILRTQLLPVVQRDWENLSNENKAELTTMFNFFCKIHILPNFASESNKVLKIFEGIALNNYKPKYAMETTECGAARLVRTVVKAFHPRGCEESGVASHFAVFLGAQDEKLKLKPYKGNRFNILYYDAAAVYYHINHIVQFVSQWPNPNRLLSAINEDLKVKVYRAEIRALGLVDKVVTGPYWRIVEKVKSILDINTHLLQMKIMLEAWTKDASPILEGETMFAADVAEIHKDALYERLMEETGDAEFDSMTIQALEMIMHALLLILERHCEDQLPGGKYYNLSEDSVCNVPTTNVAGERDFAILDLLVRTKPAARTLCYEVLIMWSNNKTRVWLDSMDPTAKEKLMDRARRGATSYREKYNERMMMLKRNKLEKMRKKQEEKEKSDEKQYSKKVELTNKIDSVWTSVNDNLLNLTEKQQRSAIVLQINFHKSVLKSKGRKELFQQSCQGTRYSLQQLKDNLQEIINENPVLHRDLPSTSSESVIQPQESRDICHMNEKQKLRGKLNESRRKRKIKRQQKLLPSYVNNLELLVNKRILHKCIEEGTSEPEWCAGTVVKLAKTHVNPLKSVYLVQYDKEDEETVWHFPLLVDFKNGDLLLLDTD